MKKYGYIAAAVGLAAATGLLVTSCASRILPGQSAGPSFAADAAKAVQGASSRPLARPAGSVPAEGKVAVQIPWPEFKPDRKTQFTYGGGSAVSAVEVLLFDSLHNYQSAVVLRNTAANGTASGSAFITFTGVPAGPAVITVHTTTRNLLGDLIIGASDAPTSYISNIGGATHSVTPMSGDQNSQFLVFRSSDLLGGAAANGAPSVYLTMDRVHDTGGRTNANEMTDGATSARAGYGIGATKVTVPSRGSVEATINVTAAPTFAAESYLPEGEPVPAATFSATDTAFAMTLKGQNVVAGGLLPDEILATNSALHLTALANRTEIVDLAKDLGYRIPISRVTGDTLEFNTTRAFLPIGADKLPNLNIYLLRGSAMSLIHLSRLQPPRMTVLPDIVANDKSSLIATGKSLRAGETDTIKLVLKDKFGNPISDIGKWAGPNANNVIKRTVSPLAIDPNATRLLVPGKTYGNVSTFACTDPGNKPGVWTATYTQGSMPATTKGASPSIVADVIPGNIIGLAEFLLRFDAFEANNTAVVIDVLNSGGDFQVNLYSTQGATESSQLVATATYPSSSVNQASASLAISGYANYALVTGGALSTTAHGTTVNNIVNKVAASGASRKVGDTDRLGISVASGSTTVFSNVSVTYTWAK